MKNPQKKNSILQLTFTAVLICSFLLLVPKVWADASGCEIGAFVGNQDGIPPSAVQVQSFENLAQRNVSSVLVYWAWGDGDFPAQQLTNGITYHDGYDTHTTLQLTWEPWSRYGPYDTTYSLDNIIAGKYDNYIKKFADDCSNWGDQIRLRFAHEMVQDDDSSTPGWYPWQDQPQAYVQAWDHVRNIFKQENANNVQFVWAPNNYPADPAILAKYYPGANNVDWLGMDGYNAGEDGQPGWPYWQNFYDIFSNLYSTFLNNPQLFGNKKLMIAEFASAEGATPVNKAEWIQQAFDAIKNDFTKINAFYWFNVLKEADWRVDSSPESLAAFQQAMADPYFTSHVVPEPNSLLLLTAGISGMLMISGTKKEKGRG